VLTGAGLGLCLWGLHQALLEGAGPVAAALGTGAASLLIAAATAGLAVKARR
jgi:hypothetical protein